MCSVDIPKVPPAPPPPPAYTDPQVAITAKAKTDARVRAMQGYASTIKTGNSGLLGSATTAAQKKLLGQ